MNQQSEWLTTEQAAAFLQISRKALLQKCYRRQIPFYKLQRRNRFLRAELEAHLKKNLVKVF